MTKKLEVMFAISAAMAIGGGGVGMTANDVGCWDVEKVCLGFFLFGIIGMVTYFMILRHKLHQLQTDMPTGVMRPGAKLILKGYGEICFRQYAGQIFTAVRDAGKRDRGNNPIWVVRNPDGLEEEMSLDWFLLTD